MPGAYGPPFRPPCNESDPGTWPPKKPAFFSCYQHSRTSSKHVPKWTNITLVADWRTPDDPLFQPNGIPPYPRKSDGGCNPNPPFNCSSSGCTDPPWPDAGNCPGICGSPCNPNAVGEQKCDSWFTGVAPTDPPVGLEPCVGAT